MTTTRGVVVLPLVQPQAIQWRTVVVLDVLAAAAVQVDRHCSRWQAREKIA
jgi:hypothetical protein